MLQCPIIFTLIAVMMLAGALSSLFVQQLFAPPPVLTTTIISPILTYTPVLPTDTVAPKLTFTPVLPTETSVASVNSTSTPTMTATPLVGSTPSVVKVAILNDRSETASYWIGTNKNTWAIYQDILNADTKKRFDVSIITDLRSSTLLDYDRLVLPDNTVPEQYLADMDKWFGEGGKSIIAVDSAITYISYSGYLWENAKGTNGIDVFWDYGSLPQDQKFLLGPITQGYSTSEVFSSTRTDAQVFRSELPSDVIILSVSSTNSRNIYAVCRQVPSYGIIIILGPYDNPASDLNTLIQNAVFAWSCK